MEKLISRYDLKYYTMLKDVLYNLELNNKDYMWLISDIEAYPNKQEYEELINQKDYLLLTTKQLIKMLEDDDFQWIWAVFSAIPSKYKEEDILKHDLPYCYSYFDQEYNPFVDEPKLQHPLAEFELYAVDSTYMFIVTDNNELIKKFKRSYPLFISKFEDKTIKVKFKNKYFPNDLNLSLFVCSKSCSHAYLDTSDYAHVCEHCYEPLKRLYSLDYKKSKRNIFYSKSVVNKYNVYKEPESKEYIDDITHEDFKDGKVDCIGDIKEVWIALACCSKECGNVELIVDGSSQICPKCGKVMYRNSVKKYLLKE